MLELRYGTACIVPVGPFYGTDGYTPKTGLTIANEKISMVMQDNTGAAPILVLDNVTGATSGTDNDLNYIAGSDNAMMGLELTVGNTSYYGNGMITVTDAANHAPVPVPIRIISQAAWDEKYSADAAPLTAGDAEGLRWIFNLDGTKTKPSNADNTINEVGDAICYTKRAAQMTTFGRLCLDASPIALVNGQDPVASVTFTGTVAGSGGDGIQIVIIAPSPDLQTQYVEYSLGVYDSTGWHPATFNYDKHLYEDTYATLRGYVSLSGCTAGTLTITIDHVAYGASPLVFELEIPAVPNSGPYMFWDKQGRLYQNPVQDDWIPSAADVAAMVSGVAGLLAGSIVPSAMRARAAGRGASPVVIPSDRIYTINVTLSADFDLSAGQRVFCCAQADRAAANTTAIVNRECTITDRTARTLYITLTVAETATANIGFYHAEFVKYDADGTSNPETVYTQDWSIEQSIRK